MQAFAFAFLRRRLGLGSGSGPLAWGLRAAILQWPAHKMADRVATCVHISHLARYCVLGTKIYVFCMCRCSIGRYDGACSEWNITMVSPRCCLPLHYTPSLRKLIPFSRLIGSRFYVDVKHSADPSVILSLLYLCVYLRKVKAFLYKSQHYLFRHLSNS